MTSLHCSESPPPPSGSSDIENPDTNDADGEEEDGATENEIMLCGFDWVRFHAAVIYNRYVLCRPNVTFSTLAEGRPVAMDHRCNVAVGWLMGIVVILLTCFFFVSLMGALAIFGYGFAKELSDAAIVVAIIAIGCSLGSLCCVFSWITCLQTWKHRRC